MNWKHVAVPFAGRVLGYVAGIKLAEVMKIDIWPLVFFSAACGGWVGWRYIRPEN